MKRELKNLPQVAFRKLCWQRFILLVLSIENTDRTVDHFSVHPQENEEVSAGQDEVDGLQNLHNLLFGAAVKVINKHHHLAIGPSPLDPVMHKAQVGQHTMLIAHLLAIAGELDIAENSLAHRLHDLE